MSVTEAHQHDIDEGEASRPEDRNEKLFFDIADIIDFRPTEFDQSTWGAWNPTFEQIELFINKFGEDEIDLDTSEFSDVRWEQIEGCGTALCVAGHAAALNGYLPVYSAFADEMSWGSVSLAGDDAVDTSTKACELLGLTEEEADILFEGSMGWTGDDLRKFGKGEDILHFQMYWVEGVGYSGTPSEDEIKRGAVDGQGGRIRNV